LIGPLPYSRRLPEKKKKKKKKKKGQKEEGSKGRLPVPPRGFEEREGGETEERPPIRPPAIYYGGPEGKKKEWTRPHVW